MAVVNSIVSLTARGASSLPDFIGSLVGRFTAISRTNEALIGGSMRVTELRNLLVSELTAFRHEDDRFVLTGPDVTIDGKLALDLALVFHELATNAAKYGALSNDAGRIRVDWQISPDNGQMLDLTWRESGGPAVVVPERSGFGSQLITRLLDKYRGRVALAYHPDGVCCTISVPIAALVQRSP